MSDSRSSANDWEDPRTVLRRYGFEPKRSFSQNFLTSRTVVAHTVAAADAVEGQPVVELGPGVGTLTSALLQTGTHVYAVELDREMVHILTEEFGSRANFHLVHRDMTTLQIPSLDESFSGLWTVVGNLPYAITGLMMRSLIEQKQHLRRVVLMIQKEVAQRLMANPSTKAYGMLSVFTNAVFSVDSVVSAPAGAFFPKPKVDSAVLRLTPLPTPRASLTPTFSAIVRASFQSRRKTLKNALKTIAQAHATHIDDALDASGIDPSRRGETLGVEEFETLSVAWDRIEAESRV